MSHDDVPPSNSTNASAPQSRFFGFLTLGVVGAVVFVVLLSQLGKQPPPAEIASDPLLVQGREIYLNRCVSCHGDKGAGDGSIAKSLTPPPPGNFLSKRWKHGKEPDQILNVIRKGAVKTAMPAFQGLEDEPSLQAVAAYVLHLAGEPIPPAWRADPAAKSTP